MMRLLRATSQQLLRDCLHGGWELGGVRRELLRTWGYTPRKARDKPYDELALQERPILFHN